MNKPENYCATFHSFIKQPLSICTVYKLSIHLRERHMEWNGEIVGEEKEHCVFKARAWLWFVINLKGYNHKVVLC